MTNPPVGVPTCYRHPDRETWIRCQRCEKSICPDCMTEASVGFQCPDCVAEGRRSVRQAKGAYGGSRTTNPGVISIGLIVTNVAVWIAIMASGGNSSRLADWFALRAKGVCLDSGQAFDTTRAACDAGSSALWLPGVSDGALWQLLTSMFTHIEPWHLGFNMLALWFLGPQLERVLGHVRYLVLYFLAGLTGSATIYWLAGEYTGTVGASGAVFGLMGALIVVGLKVGGQVQQLLLWVGINVALTFTIPNVSWQGHLGGFVGGAAIAAIIVFAPRERRTLVQGLGAGAVVVLLVVATVLRSMQLA